MTTGFPPSFQAAQAALKRKYRHLRRALGKDGMLFADEIFEIRPLQGEIWARSEIEVGRTERYLQKLDRESPAAGECVLLLLWCSTSVKLDCTHCRCLSSLSSNDDGVSRGIQTKPPATTQ